MYLDGRRPTPEERADWAALAARSEFLPVTFLASRPALDLPLLRFPPLPKERADLEEAFLMLNSSFEQVLLLKQEQEKLPEPEQQLSYRRASL